MNLEESNEFLKNQDNQNKKKVILMIGIIICTIIVLLLFFAILVLKIKDSNTKKLNINGKKETLSAKLFLNKDNVDYVSVEMLGEYTGYRFNKGEYRKYTEEPEFCYVENDYEVIAFETDSNIVKKYLLNKTENENDEENKQEKNIVPQTNETITYTVKSSNNTMELYELENKVIQVDNNIYVPISDINSLFNINFSFDNNTYKIYTLEYLVKYAKQYAEKIGITEISYDYENVRALVDNMLVAKDTKQNYGVISLVDGKEILGFKYENIQYIQNTKEFFVYAEGTVGVLDVDGKTVISPKKYESLNVFDEINKLYLAKNSKAEFGILNRDGKEIVPTSFDEIGVKKLEEDFELEDTETPNLLDSNLIVVYENKKFGLYDTKGKMLMSSKFDGLGYLKTSEDIKEDKESVLVIPEDYKIYGIVVENNGLYGIFDLKAESLTIPTVFSKIYSKKEAGELKYYLQFKDEIFDLEEYLEEYGLTSSDTKKKSNKKDEDNDVDEEDIIDEETDEEDEIDEDADEEIIDEEFEENELEYENLEEDEEEFYEEE